MLPLTHIYGYAETAREMTGADGHVTQWEWFVEKKVLKK